MLSIGVSFQTWSLFSVGLAAALMGAASAVGLTVSVIRAIIHGGRSLLTHCRFPDAIGYSSVTNECPFDPTRIYVSTHWGVGACPCASHCHAEQLEAEILIAHNCLLIGDQYGRQGMSLITCMWNIWCRC